jgi:hypothetical protein
MSSATRQRGLSVWPYLGFMVLFLILLAAVSHWYLLPAMRVYKDATPNERRLLGADALTLMSVILILLALFLVLIFRIGRFIFPRPTVARTKTKYVDAWAEAGRRLQPDKDPEK